MCLRWRMSQEMASLMCVTELLTFVLLTSSAAAQRTSATATVPGQTEEGEYPARNRTDTSSLLSNRVTIQSDVVKSDTTRVGIKDHTTGVNNVMKDADITTGMTHLMSNVTDIIYDITHYNSNNIDGISTNVMNIRYDMTTAAADISTVANNINTEKYHDWIQKESQNFTLYWAGWYIHLIWLPIIVPIGIAGNLMSFLIMMKKENRRISCCLYMAALAITDSVALSRKGYEWLIYSFGKPYVQIECQILAYLGLGSIQYGMFLIIGMTVDRVLAIKFPLKAHLYCSTARAKVTIFILLVVTCLYNIPHFLTARHFGNPPYTCSTFAIPIPYLNIYAWASTVMNFILPFIGLLVMNIIIVSTIRKRTKNLSIGNNNASVDNSADRQLSIMLSLVGVFFVILNVPQCVRLTMFLFVDRWSSPYNHAIYVFVFHLSNKTYYTNNGINFFLYCIGGSKFRQSLRELCCCCCSMLRRQEKSPVTDSSSLNSV